MISLQLKPLKGDVMLKKFFNIPNSIILFYIVAQIVCLFVFGYTPYPDSEGYIYLAKECLGEGTFYPADLTGIPFLWNIGAVNAVALSLYVTGSVLPLLIVYSIMQGLMAWLLYVIARELFNEKTALFALALFVLYPANYACGTSAHSEVPFIFFSLLAVFLSLKDRYFFAGVCFAIANYFRPMAVVFVLALLLLMLYRRLRLQKYLYLLAGMFLVTVSIGVTNYVAKGKYFTQGAMGWMGLMQYSWDNDSDRQSDYILFGGNDPNVIDEELRLDCLQRDSVWRSHFLIWLKNNKIEYVRQMPEKVVRTYASDNVGFCAFMSDKAEREYMYDEICMPTLLEDFPDWTPLQLLTVLNLVYYYCLLLFAMCGVAYGIRRKRILGILLPTSVILAGTAVLVLVGHGEARFHQPFMAMFIILAAYAIYETPKIHKKTRI